MTTAPAPRLLVADDEAEMRELLHEVFVSDGWDVTSAVDGRDALDRFAEARPDVVLLDLNMPRLGGMDTLAELRRLDPDVSVVVLTAYLDVPHAVQAMRLGAYDYQTKPFAQDQIVLAVRRALERRRLVAEVQDLRSRAGPARSLREQMGPGEAIREVIRQVEQVADSPVSVLIEGETGTGKELVARAIHQASARRAGPFVALDCGAVPDSLIESELFGYERGAFTGADRRREGYFTLASGGTLFLDEVGNLPLVLQAALLRVLQERQVQPLGASGPVAVDVRVLAATNQPLDTLVEAGRFRQDLYYRLNEFRLVLPPLRQRRGDVLVLARRFLAEAAMEFRRPTREISDEAAALLERHEWPGNVRELRNVVRQAVLRSDGLIRPEHLVWSGPGPGPEPASPAPAPGEAVSLAEVARRAAVEAERGAIRRALAAASGNKSEAARLLRTDYKTLHVKMRQHGISAAEFRPRG